VEVTDLTIEGADNGLRIKSNDSRGGPVDGITYSDVCIRATKNPIVLQTSYTPSDPFEHGKVPVYTGIVFRHVHIDGPGAITLEGHDPSHPLHLSFEDVQVGQDVTTHRVHADLATSNAAPGVTCAGRFVPMPRGATVQGALKPAS
jgi:polygalacturonase